MAGFRIEGDTGGHVMEVDANGNGNVTLPAVQSQAGYAVGLFENDAGTITGTPTRRSPRVSQDYRLGVGLDTVLFSDNFNATAQNTSLWRTTISSGMAATQSGGSVLLNSGSTLTTLAAIHLATWRTFALNAGGGLRFATSGAFTAQPLANQICEFGMGPYTIGGLAPGEGAFFRYTSAGLIGVLSYSGVETPTGVLLAPADFTDAKFYEFGIRIDSRGIEFFRDDVKLGSLAIPDANGLPFMQTATSVILQFRNAGTVSGTPVMQAKFGYVSVLQRDVSCSIPFESQMSINGLAGYQGQNGHTMGSTALYTNSLAAGAGVAMSNTGALGAGLGGQFTTQPTLAAGTDGIVCNYQNPVGTSNVTARTLLLKGIRIQSAVTATLTGGPCLYAYSLAFGHTALSLATAETGSFVTSSTKAPRRIALGFESIAAASAVGVIGQGVYMKFDFPIPIAPGEHVSVVAKNLGTVTSAGTVTFHVTPDVGFF